MSIASTEAPLGAIQATTRSAAAGGPRLLELALLLLGATLRIWQYAAGASQWLDELALSRGILGLSWWALLAGPLPYAQVAPKGFLLLEKSGTTLWGASDLGLRLLPLACSLASLWLFARLARRRLEDPAAAAFALALFALQPELIRYASQVKPYACDLTASLALTLMAGRLVDGRERPEPWPRPGRLAWCTGAAVVALALSHGAALVLAGLACALVAGVAGTGVTYLRVRRGRRSRRVRLAAPAADTAPVLPPRAASAIEPAGVAGATVVAVAWLLAAGAVAIVASREMAPATRDFLASFWAPAFAPLPQTPGGDAHWAAASLVGLLAGGGMGYPWLPVYAVMAAVGVVTLWRRSPAHALLLVSPTAVALAAAEVHLYPFASRLVLFAEPPLLLAIAAGVSTVATLAATAMAAMRPATAVPTAPTAPTAATAGRARPAAALAATAILPAAIYTIALLPAAAGFAADPPVYRIEETRPLLRELAARRQPGDALYVYYGAGQAIRYYGPRYGLQPADYLLGGCHRGDTAAYLAELDRYRGRPRLWVVFSHAQPRLGEQAAILAHLDHLGTRREALRSLPSGHRRGMPAEAYLYDLTTAATRADATTPTVPTAPAAPLARQQRACTGPANPYPEPAAAAAR